VSLDIGRATSAGQELQPLLATLGYDEAISLGQLKIGQPGNVIVEGAGNFDRARHDRKTGANAGARRGPDPALIAPRWHRPLPRGSMMGTVRARAPQLDLEKYATGRSRQCALSRPRATLGGVTIPSQKPALAAVRGMSRALGRGEIGIETRLSSGEGGAPSALLGLNNAIASATARRNSRVATGAWRGPLRLKVKVSGRTGCRRASTAEPWAAEPRPAQFRRSQHQSRAAVRSQAIACAGAEHQPVVAGFASATGWPSMTWTVRSRLAAARARGFEP
jgi:large subunit ribosomal protein L24